MEKEGSLTSDDFMSGGIKSVSALTTGLCSLLESSPSSGGEGRARRLGSEDVADRRTERGTTKVVSASRTR